MHLQNDLRLIELRYPARCLDCSTLLTPGTKAYWDTTARLARCVVCPAPVADPFAVETRDEVLRGVAGRSAGAESLRRSHSAAAENWAKGQQGEAALGRLLEQKRTHDRDIETLHDRRIPGSKANLDHLVVAPTGVYVINTKKWSGKIVAERRVFDDDRLVVGGRNRARVIECALHERDVVRDALGGQTAVHPVVCFVEGQWAGLRRAFSIQGVLVASPAGLLRRLGKSGAIASGRRQLIYFALAEAFPEA